MSKQLTGPSGIQVPKIRAESETQTRRRRNISKNRQGVKQREKTPEPGKGVPHEDTTTTDEDDGRNSREVEADDIYEEMKRMVQRKTGEKDDDDIDIDELREQRKMAEQDRRRRSISPYSKPSPEELEQLRRRRPSYIDPDTNLLGIVPVYTLGPKGHDENLVRKDSLNVDIRSERSNSLSVPSSPSTPSSPPNENHFPFPKKEEKPKGILREYTPSPSPSPQPTKKSIEVAKTEVIKTTKTEDPIAPPVKPVRSKSGTRSDGKASESETSGDKKTPKPKERRKTIAAIKRNAREISNQKRSQSATRPSTENAQSKTSTEIMELLQKANRRSLSIPKERTATKDDWIDPKRRVVTPCRTPETPNSKLRSPKTIQLINAKDILEGMTTAQRLELEMSRSRRSSGYIEASQSEYTSSCYSSSYSEDDSDFDLSKRTAELNRKLTELSLENEELKSVVRNRLKGEPKPKPKTSKEKPLNPPTTKIGKFIYILRHLWTHWYDFKYANYHQYMKIINIRNRCIGDFVLVTIFCGLGGLAFRYAEGGFENMYKCNAKRVKRDFIENLWQGVHRLNEEDWKSMARRKLWEFESQLSTAHEAGVRSNTGQTWNFMNSVVFCLTVITTIGYGHIAPATTTGRIMTIIYAIFGIPMFLILLADFGKLFTRCIKFLWAFVRRLYYTGSCRNVRKTVPIQEVMKGFNFMADAVRRVSHIDPEAAVGVPQVQPAAASASNQLSVPTLTKIEDGSTASEPLTPAPSAFEIDDEFNLPISLAVTILILYIIIGAVVYDLWERWGFFEAFYFVFISMSTIGFGDFVPKHPMYMMASIVYLVFGLALTSMCINVVQVKLSDSFKQASVKIGATMGLKVLEEDGSLVPVTPPEVEMPEVHGAAKNSQREQEQEGNDIERKVE